MFPWRSGKAALLEEERARGGKRLAAALGLSPLLAALLRAAPGAWGRCSPGRLGSAFRRRRQKLQLTAEDPSYTAWYLGSAVTLAGRGEGCCREALRRIWARSWQGAAGTRVQLSIGPHGLRMGQAEQRGREAAAHLYLLHRISYSAAEPQRGRLFAWVYRHQLRHKAVVLRCHAALLSRAEQAQALARLLRQASAAALSHFQRLKRQDDARHRQQQRLGELSVPRVPIRRLLNGQCPYRPPAERSGPRLGSIAEDVQGEEAEESSSHPPSTFTRSQPDISGIARQIHRCSIGQELRAAGQGVRLCSLETHRCPAPSPGTKQPDPGDRQTPASLAAHPNPH
ncbi:protein FAM43B [Mustelus asterias]